MEILFIRHGQSANNVLIDSSKRVCDPALTEQGKKQAQILADALSGNNGLRLYVEDLPIERLFCSPMMRALETAFPISRELKIEPEVWLDIHEHGGVFLEDENNRISGYPGVTRETIRDRFPDFILPDGLTDQGWWKGSKEAPEAWVARAVRAARKLRSCIDRYKKIAVLSHGGFIDTLLKALLNQIPGNHLFYHLSNTSVTSVVFSDEYRVRINYMNRIDHLSRVTEGVERPLREQL